MNDESPTEQSKTRPQLQLLQAAYCTDAVSKRITGTGSQCERKLLQFHQTILEVISSYAMNF